MIKFDNFAKFININSFLSKSYSLKNFDLLTMSNLTHLQDGNTKVKFLSRIIEKINVGFETGFGSGVGSGSENNRKERSGSEKKSFRIHNPVANMRIPEISS